jgi:hypothetical protein
MAKSSMLLCVGSDEGSLLPAPYLDSWGEEVRLPLARAHGVAVASPAPGLHVI